MTLEDIIGRWQVVAWRQDYDDGRVVYPMGENLGGFIQYGPDGDVSVLIARRGRERFTGGQWNASDAEKARAYDGFMSYCGRYELQGDEVVHHIDLSLFPNFEGGQQRRRATLRDGKLHLTARLETDTPEARTISLVWERGPSR